MCDLDSSFQLLSSMSPNLKKREPKKKLQKSPHKLALKKHFRRSSIYDKVPNTCDIVIIDDTIISDNSSSKNLKSPVTISSTSEEDSDQNSQVLKVTPNFVDIDNWLSENEKVDGYSQVFSFKNNSSESDDQKINKSLEKNVSNPSGKWKVLDIHTKLGTEKLRTPARNENLKKPSSNYSDNNLIENSDAEQNIAEKLLDDLYGKSWRKNQDEILIRSEPRKKKNNKSPINLPKTERKEKRKSPKSPWVQRLKELCDSDSSDNSLSSNSNKSITNTSNNCKKLSFSDSEDDNSSCNMILSKKNSNRSSVSSFEIDLSDNDSLRTRLRKKIENKAKDEKKAKNLKKTKDENKMKKEKEMKDDTKKTDKRNDIQNKKIDKSKHTTAAVNQQNYTFLQSLSGDIAYWQSNKEAHYYRINYKTEKAVLAKKLFDLYNEKIFENKIPTDTPLEWNGRMRGTAGFCYNRRIAKADGTVLRSCRIVLATKILDTPDRLRDTLVHEMCHAATWLVNNVSDGHGPYWKTWAYKAMQAFPELPPIKRCHDYQITTKYTYKCAGCGYSVGRHSKSLDTERKRCGYCFGKFEVFINKVNKKGEKQTARATPKAKPSDFALYVKENYSSVKKQNMKHGDVMKILGQQFSSLKLNNIQV